jgi:hypothetical protein
MEALLGMKKIDVAGLRRAAAARGRSPRRASHGTRRGDDRLCSG